MSESKPKHKLRARASRAWDKVFGTPSSTAPPSPMDSSPAPVALTSTSVALVYQSAEAPEGYLLAPAPPSLRQSVPVSSSEVADSQELLPPTAAHIQEPLSTEGRTVVWSRLRSALQNFHESCSLFPPLQSVIGDLISCIETVQQSEKNEAEFEELMLQLTTASESLGRHLQESKSALMTDSILKTTQSIQKQIELIRSRQARRTRRRPAEVERNSDKVMKCYRQIQVLFNQLQIDANLSIWCITNEQLANTRLRGLQPVRMATYDSSLSTNIDRRMCTEKTRTDVLSGLDSWSNNPNAPNVYWMNGMAGTGKTTIACTFADSLKKRKQLAASFFCTRTSPECQDVTRVIPTIAYQLARYSTPFQSALCRVLGSDPDLDASVVPTQFQKLLGEPLLEVRDAMPEGLVVVIDALDECTAPKGVELMLDMLFRTAGNLPLKFFVTSRPDPVIRNKIHSQPNTTRSVFVLHDIEESLVQSDIELYLREELDPKVITPLQVKQLAKLSGRLFIYAATAVRYIKIGEKTGDLRWRLQTMLSITSPSERKNAAIDQLYGSILSAAINDESFEEREKDCMRLVLWTAVSARQPISVETLTELAGVSDHGKTLAMLQPLRSVLYVSENNNLVTTPHASLPDFILDQTRSFIFFCDAKHHNQLLTQGCFRIMRQQLRFNICELESSYIPDGKVPNLEERVAKAVSPTLGYACRYWADHLRQAAASTELCGLTQEFLSESLLFWMEVVNLKHWTEMSPQIISTAKVWLTQGGCAPAELVDFVDDARTFVTAFAANTVSRSTPHLYLSALGFCHRSSSVFKQYSRRTQRLLGAKGTGIECRGVALLASWISESTVQSVTYCHEGTRLAIGCGDGSIIIRDAYNGALVGTPLKGHTGSVTSVAASPDGSHIASGSVDKTIRVWNVQDGALVRAPFEGHTAAVRSVVFSGNGAVIISGSDDGTIRLWAIDNGMHISTRSGNHAAAVVSVAFSPNDLRFVSGSHDGTVRVWSAQNNVFVGTPFKGHTNWVRSVAFSPDGSRIVSGSDDKTIRVWNSRDGALVGIPFKGHTAYVQSVAFSPDGSRIVSGSGDETIRVWNVQDGTPIGTPFKGHTGSVTSVAFSPDGSHIVSGSQDKTTRVWNVQEHTLVSTPFGGHTGYVTSVAFSPDGSRIVSGSGDKAVRVSNVQKGAPIGTPFKGHTAPVKAVAFSPDSLHFVSGSSDKTIQMWDVQYDFPVRAPFKGHTDCVTSVAFSPDGLYIVSGSDDTTVRVLHIQDNALVGVPFIGHDAAVLSVAFSPDGSHIVSGSDDKTIRVWSVQDGALIGTPIKGHTSYVTSVAFSPDGLHIVSGSGDKTIRVWSVQDGSPAGTPFKGHTGAVRSVAFSPDSLLIASGSSDRTIRVWNARDGALVGTPFKGHTRCSAHGEDRHEHLSSRGREFLSLDFLLSSPGGIQALLGFIKATRRFADSLR